MYTPALIWQDFHWQGHMNILSQCKFRYQGNYGQKLSTKEGTALRIHCKRFSHPCWCRTRTWGGRWYPVLSLCQTQWGFGGALKHQRTRLSSHPAPWRPVVCSSIFPTPLTETKRNHKCYGEQFSVNHLGKFMMFKWWHDLSEKKLTWWKVTNT